MINDIINLQDIDNNMEYRIKILARLASSGAIAISNEEEAFSYIIKSEGKRGKDWEIASEGVFETDNGKKFYFIEIFKFSDRKIFCFQKQF